MRFLRTVLYVGVLGGAITLWELNRATVLDFFSKEKVVPATAEKVVTAEKTETPSEESKSEPSKSDPRPQNPGDFSRGFTDVAKKAMNSVVNVATLQVIKEEDPADIFGGIFKGDPFEGFLRDFFGNRVPTEKKERKAATLGSGFIVKVDKKNQIMYVVTNNHVIDKAKKIVLYLYDKTELPAKVHAVDQRTDIAVLAVDVKILKDKIDLLQPIEWGNSDNLEEGSWVLAIGNPFGLGSSMTSGIVSSKGRDLPIGGGNFVNDFIQHSAQINSGNSGGCLLDVDGRVVGVNNAILSVAGGNIGISFAIPANIVRNTVEQLIKHKRTFRGWLGVEVQNVLAKQAESVGIDVGDNLNPTKVFAAFVSKVIPGGPAEKGGLKRGDIIIAFNGVKIADKGGLTKIVGEAKIDEKSKIVLLREDKDGKLKEVELTVVVGDFEKAEQSGKIGSGEKDSNGNPKEEEITELGITVSKIPEKMRSAAPAEFVDNLLVTKVDESVFFGFSGPLFMPGDIIVKVAGNDVKTVSQLKEILEKIKKGKDREKPIPFVVIRGGVMVMLATTINFNSDTKTGEKSDKEEKQK